MLEEFLAYMNEQGWNIELNEKREMHLPKVIEEGAEWEIESRRK